MSKILKNILNSFLLASVFFSPLYLLGFSFLGFPTNFFEILFFLTFAFWLSEKIFFDRLSKITFVNSLFIIQPFDFLLSGLIVSTIINGNYFQGLGVFKSWFFIPFFLGFIIFEQASSLKKTFLFIKVLCYSGFTVSAVALIYKLTGFVTFDNRLAAFYSSPNYLAMFLAPLFPLVYWLFFLKNSKPKKYLLLEKSFVFLGFFLMSLVVYFTFSYAAIFSILIAFFLAEIIFNKKLTLRDWKKTLFPIAIFILFISSQFNTEKFQTFFNLEEKSSLSSRVAIWKASFLMIKNNFFFGIGPNNFQSVYLEYQKYFPPYPEWAVPQPHNLYLAFWLESGLLGFFAFLWLVIAWSGKIISAYYHAPVNQKRTLLKALFTGVLIILLHGFADTPYWKNDLSVIFWLLIFLGASIHVTRKKINYPS